MNYVLGLETEMKYFVPKFLLDHCMASAKNARLMGESRRLEPLEGHTNWSQGQRSTAVIRSLTRNIERARDSLGDCNKYQLIHVFANIKNAWMSLEHFRTEPLEGHLNWATYQTRTAIRREVRRLCNRINSLGTLKAGFYMSWVPILETNRIPLSTDAIGPPNPDRNPGLITPKKAHVCWRARQNNTASRDKWLKMEEQIKTFAAVAVPWLKMARFVINSLCCDTRRDSEGRYVTPEREFDRLDRGNYDAERLERYDREEMIA